MADIGAYGAPGTTDRPIGGMQSERSALDREEADLDESLRFIADEFRAGFRLVGSIDRPAVAIFGSARTPADHPLYRQAMEIAAGFARQGFAVVTGGGPGLMEAANRGAKEAGGLSVGLGIRLPFEERPNPWLDLSYEFKHFYARKVSFVKASEGFVAFPGGWGTNDELFEALTLIQTHKIEHFPVVLFGSEHWRPFGEWAECMADEGLISQEDLGLVAMTDDPQEAVRMVVDCYRRECAHTVGA